MRLLEFAAMAADPARRRDVVVASVVLALPLVAGVIAVWGRRYYPTADGALIEMQVRDIPSHMPLMGVYSRYDFHHPGPAMFFWLMPFYRVAGLQGLLLGPAALHIAALSGCAYLLHRRGGRALLLLGTGALLLLERAMIADLLDTWNPWLAVTTFVLAILLAWSVWERDWWALPWLVAAVTFVVQTHLGYGVVSAVPVVVAVLAVGLSWRHERCPTRVLVAAAGVAALGWVLPLLEQVRHDPGNLTLILRALRDPQEPPAGAAKAFDALSQTLGVQAPWVTGNERVEPFTARVSGAPSWTLVIPVVLFVGAAILAWRRGRRSALALQGITAASVVVAFLAVTRITGEPYPYITRWLWVVALFVWTSAIWSLVDVARTRDDFLRPEVSDRRWPPAVMVGGAGAAVVAVIAVVAVVAGARADLPRRLHSNAVEHTIEEVTARLDPSRTVQVFYEGGGWSEEQAGFIAELERRGFTAWGLDTPDEVFRMGAHRTPQGANPDVRLIVVIDSQFIGARLAKGQVPVVMWDPLPRADRDEYVALRLRFAAEYDDALNNRPVADPLPQSARDRVAALDAQGLPVAVFIE